MSKYDSGPRPESVPLRDISPPASVTSDDFDRLLSEDEAVSEGSSFDIGFSQGPSHPPTDRGRHAWTFLAACWLVEAMLWAFPLAFGIFQSYYSSHPLFQDSDSIPTIGTLATGSSYLGMPFVNAIVLRWPQYQRQLCLFGWLLCVLGLVGASFATKVWQLLLFQGLIYGIGWVVCYTPFLFMLNGWFIKKRGLAYGILFGASGVSGLVIPLVVGHILDRFGFRVALRVYAIVTVFVSIPGFFLIKPRIKPSITPPTASELHKLAGESDSIWRVVQSPHFAVFTAAIFIQGLAFFLPNVFLPSYAISLSLPLASANSLLALLSLSQVVGQLTMGYVSDTFNPYYPTSIAALASGLGAVFLWGPAKGMWRLVPFALLWGFFSASYSVLYMSVCTFLTKDPALAMTVYGVFSFERGMANILEGPISTWLNGEQDVDVEKFALGRYHGVVWFTGVCMFLSSLGIAGLFIRKGRA